MHLLVQVFCLPFHEKPASSHESELRQCFQETPREMKVLYFRQSERQITYSTIETRTCNIYCGNLEDLRKKELEMFEFGGKSASAPATMVETPKLEVSAADAPDTEKEVIRTTSRVMITTQSDASIGDGPSFTDFDDEKEGKKRKGSRCTGLNKEELQVFINDPYWVRVRCIMHILLWVVIVCLLAGAIVILVISVLSPCEK